MANYKLPPFVGPLSMKPVNDPLANLMKRGVATIASSMVFLFFSLLLTSCASYDQAPPLLHHDTSSNLIEISYNLADNLIGNMEEVALLSTGMPIGKDEPILASTFVDVKTLEPDSDFGRVIADQVASRFVQKGYNLLETKLRKDGILIHEGMGELLLSRKLQEIGQSFSAAYVIIGTYSVAAHSIFMNVKVISVTNSRIMASGNTEIEINNAVMDLLQQDNKIQVKRFTNKSIH